MKPNYIKQLVKEAIQEYSKTLPKKAYLIVSLQYDDAKPVNDLISQGKYNDAIKYLAQWDYGGENKHTVYDMPYGTASKTYKRGPYVLVWNPQLDDTVILYRTARGSKKEETISKTELKEVIKHTLRSILMEMHQTHSKLSMLEEGPLSAEDLQAAWQDDQTGEYIQINPDDSVWYVAHGRAREQIAPKGSNKYMFRLISQWSRKNGIYLNIWQVNDHGNVSLFNQKGKLLGGLAENINEMTTTSAVDPINLPGNVKGGWVSPRGGSRRGVAGSAALGYTLTPIGKQDMNRKQDPV